MEVKARCLILISSLLMSLTPVWSDLTLMHPLGGLGGVGGLGGLGGGGLMLQHDVSFDSPDYHYLAASPLGGYVAHDIDNVVATGGIGLGALGGGLNVLPSAYGGLLGGGAGLLGGRGIRLTTRRRFGKRIGVIHI